MVYGKQGNRGRGKSRAHVHSQERPFACDKCIGRFDRQCELDEHRRTHVAANAGETMPSGKLPQMRLPKAALAGYDERSKRTTFFVLTFKNSDGVAERAVVPSKWFSGKTVLWHAHAPIHAQMGLEAGDDWDSLPASLAFTKIYDTYTDAAEALAASKENDSRTKEELDRSDSTDDRIAPSTKRSRSNGTQALPNPGIIDTLFIDMHEFNQSTAREIIVPPKDVDILTEAISPMAPPPKRLLLNDTFRELPKPEYVDHANVDALANDEVLPPTPQKIDSPPEEVDIKPGAFCICKIDVSEIKNGITDLLRVVGRQSKLIDRLSNDVRRLKEAQHPNGPVEPHAKFACQEHLPCDSYEALMEFEESMDKKDVTGFMFTIGGSHPRKLIANMANETYSKELQIRTTWRGTKDEMGLWMKKPLFVTKIPNIIAEVVVAKFEHVTKDDAIKMFQVYMLHALDRKKKQEKRLQYMM